MDPAQSLPLLLMLAWLLPLASFSLIVLFGPKMGPGGRYAGGLATVAIVGSCVLSMVAFFGVWLPAHPLSDASHHGDHHGGEHHDSEHPDSEHHEAAPAEHDDHGDEGHAAQAEIVPALAVNGHAAAITAVKLAAPAAEGGAHDGHAASGASNPPPPAYSGDWYSLGEFGRLKVTIGYYIDSLTVAMFCMVTLIASCIHFYANGYMHDELHDVTDHQVTLSDGSHLHRPGRFHRFFQYLSLFCFSMLGLVIAGNIAMVFVFWELVGICSYFLIGFYIERKSASTAANKAFIVNRVGDFGMIIGLMALWGSLGTFSFADTTTPDGSYQPGIFTQVRSPENNYQLVTPTGMVMDRTGVELAQVRREHVEQPQDGESEIAARVEQRRAEGAGYWLLVVAGLGIFCGCVGKSAQFPLHVWLPDAMEGPTPVSALVHSATMVAAGVYLVGRFYPVFAPEVLLTIAYVGCITLLLAATIAITATDIKRVLAYSTVSQLGYMMLALGLGGWLAGMMHLFTHAFFKSLLFMCSGSVIHAVHTNEMTEMGGLRKKMPWTAYTMLVGCLAIIGAGLPFAIGGWRIGMSGYYSKDAIIEQAMNFAAVNPVHNVLFFAAAGGAAITAFYMFRMWYMTFAGTPRDHHRYDHAHESPKVMYYPLVLLSLLAIGVAWPLPWGNLSLANILEQARPAGTLAGMPYGLLLHSLVVPSELLAHNYQVQGTLIAFSTAMAGLLLATVIYAWRLIDAEEIRQQFRGVHRFLINKWWFDELYNALFVQPTHFVARRIAQLDQKVIDGLVNGAATVTRWLAQVHELVIDRSLVDGSIDLLANRTWRLGVALHAVQTGRLRQYVMFIVIATVALFVVITFFWGFAVAR